MFEKEIAEGWEMVENYGSIETDRGEPFFITRWFNERMNAETFVVIDAFDRSRGTFKSYEDAVKYAEDLATNMSLLRPHRY